MEIIWKVIYSLIGLNIIQICYGLPINVLSTVEGWSTQTILIMTIALSASVISIIIGCVCCQRKQGFKDNKKEFRDSPVSASVISEQIEDPGHVNPIAISEFTIFTPLSPPHHNNNVFRHIEASNSTERIEESRHKINVLTPEISSWFGDLQTNFPRHKLKYIRELGSGWFGRVVEGEAQGIVEDQIWTQVAVRILESCASAQEQSLFLHEAAMYRLEQPHPNVLRLLGYCLESTPLLLIQEYCARGDMKKFLLENNTNCNSPIMANLPLRFSCQITSALQYLHDNRILHPDLAARNVQLTQDLNPKLGDYGSSVNTYPHDYYQGVPAIPVRWCAPETLNFTCTTLQPKQMTIEGNVWSLGVTMWEICEWGSQPYEQLTDDDVISRVLGSPHVRLPKPSKSNTFYTEHLYRLMQLCWMPADERPTVGHIYDMLIHLLQLCNNGSPSKTQGFSTQDFDSRWDNFKPNTIVKTDNQIIELTIPEKITDVSSTSSIGESYMDPLVKKSASLTNLHGSFDNLCEENAIQNTELDSWLQNVATDTGDMQYVRGLSQAIHELDSALASEPTSSTSSHQPSPATDRWDLEREEPIKIEFKLGECANSTFGVDSNEPSSLLDSILYTRNESGSETEDETWKRRIERGAYSEKVRQKSKSVADLMVLTHIDCSDTDSETPLQSLEWKNGHAYKNVRCASRGALDTSMVFGSEGNLLQVQDTFQEELRKLQEERRDSLLFVPSYNRDVEEEEKEMLLPEKIEAIKIEDDLLKQNLQVEMCEEVPKMEINETLFDKPEVQINDEKIDSGRNLEEKQILIPEKIDVKKIEDDVFMENLQEKNEIASDIKIKEKQFVVPQIQIEEDKNDFVQLPDSKSITEQFLLNEQTFNSPNEIIEEPQRNVKTESNIIDATNELLIESFDQPLEVTTIENVAIPENDKQLENIDETNESVHVDQINIGLVEEASNVTNEELITNRMEEFNESYTEREISRVENKNIELKDDLENKNAFIPEEKLIDFEEKETVKITDIDEDFQKENITASLLPTVDTPFYFDKNLANSIENFLESERKFSEFDPQSPTNDEISDTVQAINAQNLINLNTFSTPPSIKPQVFNVFSVTVDHKTPDFLNLSYDNMEQNLLKTLYDDPCEPFNLENVECDNIKDNKTNLFTSTPLVSKSKYNPQRSDNVETDQTVILGPCEDYTLELYSGLKTTLDNYYDDDRSEEEILQFSSNFMPFNGEYITNYSDNDVDTTVCAWDNLNESLRKNNETYDITNTKPDLIDSNTIIVNKIEDTIENINDNNKNDEIKDEQNEILANETYFLNTDNLNGNQKDEIDINETYDVPNNETFDVEKTPSDDSDATFTINKTSNLCITDTVTNSWEPGVGWFLHPQSQSDDLTGQIDVQSDDMDVDNSYVGFTLDEESVNALRNELAAKLPHAQGLTNEAEEMEEWDSEERDEMIVKYNVYATPLSPIPEESCCDDMFCDQTKHRDGSDSGSDWSEPERNSHLEDILIVDTETHTALILESPSPKEPLNRHTPSQDSCCSNDTLFNLEDLNGAIDVEQSPSHNVEETTDFTEPVLNVTSEILDCQNDVIEDVENDETAPMEEKSEEPSIDKSKFVLMLEPGDLNTAPLPSPEDIPWRQLPASMLTYNQVALGEAFDMKQNEADAETTSELNYSTEQQEVVSEDETELFNNLTDIRFVGPCDGQLMSTSFSESVENERDWDSGSDTRSSSSGEFIWKEGEHEESLRALHHNEGIPNSVSPMDAISEEKSDGSDDHDDDDDDDDELEETEFVPSAWDSQATPTKSALRSPEKKNKCKNQKGVWFKKEKYHCVYEYPREPDSPIAQSTDLWRPLSDFTAYTDLWELDPESCVPPLDDDTKENYETCSNYAPRDYYQLASSSAHRRDLYQLNSYPEFTSGTTAPDEDFFISSTTKPFQTMTQGSQFFPGLNNKSSQWHAYQQSSLQSSRDLSDNITPDSGIDDITPASISDPQLNYLNLKDGLPSSSVSPLKILAAAAVKRSGTHEIPVTNGSNQPTLESLGGLRHTRNKLKLDLPPSPSSFTSNRSFNIEFDTDPVVHRDVPTFTTFGKSRFSVQHVDTPVEDEPDGTCKSKNVSFEALPHKPQKLEEIKSEYIVADDVDKPKQVEVVRGEASLLDSADEDSGIESSANATLERQQVLDRE